MADGRPFNSGYNVASMSSRRFFLTLLLNFVCAFSVAAQSEIELEAKARLFPEVGPGLTAIKRDASGRYLVLSARAGAVAIYNADGQRVGQIPSSGAMNPAKPGGPASAPQAALIYGADFDVDAVGRIYVADPGADAIKVFSADGVLLRTISVKAPNSVVALPDDEVAVSSAEPGSARERNPRLVSVFDARGKLARQFADPIDIAQRNEVNRLLGIGRLLPDGKGELFYTYTYLPEPTVRKFDRFGHSTNEIVLATLEFQPAAQATRREIKRQDTKGGTPSLKPVLNAVGADPQTDDVWLAIGNVLLHLDKEGNRRGAYRVFTAEGARLEPIAILVEPDRLLLASDPLGIHEFPRPDKLRR